ncbi:hypothetical protein HN747_03810 [archaeon]|jgi:hypothetical protein|nr:hypothetical protein [archaeon]
MNKPNNGYEPKPESYVVVERRSGTGVKIESARLTLSEEAKARLTYSSQAPVRKGVGSRSC